MTCKKIKNVTCHRGRWRVRIKGIVDTELADSIYGYSDGYKAAVALRNKLSPGYIKHSGWTGIEGVTVRRNDIHDTWAWLAKIDQEAVCQASILKFGYQGAFDRVYSLLCRAYNKRCRKKQAPYPVPNDLRIWLKYNGLEFPKK